MEDEPLYGIVTHDDPKDESRSCEGNNAAIIWPATRVWGDRPEYRAAVEVGTCEGCGMVAEVYRRS